MATEKNITLEPNSPLEQLSMAELRFAQNSIFASPLNQDADKYAGKTVDENQAGVANNAAKPKLNPNVYSSLDLERAVPDQVPWQPRRDEARAQHPAGRSPAERWLRKRRNQLCTPHHGTDYPSNTDDL